MVAGSANAVGPAVLEALARADQARMAVLEAITIRDLHDEVERRIRARAQLIRAERRARRRQREGVKRGGCLEDPKGDADIPFRGLDPPVCPPHRAFAGAIAAAQRRA